jgi:ribonuclease HI
LVDIEPKVQSSEPDVPPEVVTPEGPPDVEPKETSNVVYDPKIPDPKIPDPKIPDPKIPDPKIPDPKIPDSKIPYPKIPYPKIPDPKIPDSKIPYPKIPYHKIPDPKIPDPKIPDPKIPDPKIPDPKIPYHKIPDPKIPDPKIPDPKIPDPKIPDPKTPFTIFFDVASKGNPGPAGYGFYIVSPFLSNDIMRSESIGTATNNVAEYSGILAALTWLQNLIVEHHLLVELTIKGDSQLVINQLLGIYRVKQSTMVEYHHKSSKIINQLRRDGHTVNLEHIVRKFNSVADKLSSDVALGKGK